jgi:transposase
MDALFETFPDDVEALKAALFTARLNARNALAAQFHAEAIAAIALADVAQGRALIEELKLQIAKARADKWGQSSERGSRLLDQLEMQLEDLVTAATEDEIAAEMAVAKAQASGVAVTAFTRRKPVRGPLPEHLPRHRIVVPAT